MRLGPCIVEMCKFFLSKKRRFCQIPAVANYDYCAEHLPQDTTSDPRIPCPCDPKHTVFQSKLAKHLKKCNARPRERPAYWVEDANVVKDGQEESCVIDLQAEEDEVDLTDYARIRSILAPHIEGTNGYYEEFYTVGKELSKHQYQQDALCRILLSKLLLSQDQRKRTVFVEFCAGKGGLSNYFAQTFLDSFTPATFYLIDRRNFRRKHDCLIRARGVPVQRIFMDLKDLDLANLLSSDTEQVVIIGKHLCGAAECLSYRAIESLRKSRPQINILGIFASCCHHLCTWESFYGRHPIVNQKLFTMLKTISSWAVCGFREQSTVNQERILLGDTAKRLLDHYRYEGLKRIGLEVDKFDYVPAEVTLENRAVVFSTSLRKIDT